MIVAMSTFSTGLQPGSAPSFKRKKAWRRAEGRLVHERRGGRRRRSSRLRLAFPRRMLASRPFRAGTRVSRPGQRGNAQAPSCCTRRASPSPKRQEGRKRVPMQATPQYHGRIVMRVVWLSLCCRFSWRFVAAVYSTLQIALHRRRGNIMWCRCIKLRQISFNVDLTPSPKTHEEHRRSRGVSTVPDSSDCYQQCRIDNRRSPVVPGREECNRRLQMSGEQSLDDVARPDPRGPRDRRPAAGSQGHRW